MPFFQSVILNTFIVLPYYSVVNKLQAVSHKYVRYLYERYWWLKSTQTVHMNSSCNLTINIWLAVCIWATEHSYWSFLGLRLVLSCVELGQFEKHNNAERTSQVKLEFCSTGFHLGSVPLVFVQVEADATFGVVVHCLLSVACSFQSIIEICNSIYSTEGKPNKSWSINYQVDNGLLSSFI